MKSSVCNFRSALMIVSICVCVARVPCASYEFKTQQEKKGELEKRDSFISSALNWRVVRIYGNVDHEPCMEVAYVLNETVTQYSIICSQDKHSKQIILFKSTQKTS